MGRVEAAVGSIVEHNNRSVRAAEGVRPNPRPLADTPWAGALADRSADIAAEWHRFRDGGGRLPRIEEVISESQGNEGSWELGLLWSRGGSTLLAREHFAATTASLGLVPGLRSAMFSVFAGGCDLPEHAGGNAGVLRYHLGIDCGTSSSLVVEGVEHPYRDGLAVLFDDTVPHAARNTGDGERVTLFLEVLRPLPRRAHLTNRAVQAVIALDPRYRRAVDRSDAWQRSNA